MADSDEEDPIEELCEYLDLKVEQYCEEENIPAKRALFFKTSAMSTKRN